MIVYIVKICIRLGLCSNFLVNLGHLHLTSVLYSFKIIIFSLKVKLYVFMFFLMLIVYLVN